MPPPYHPVLQVLALYVLVARARRARTRPAGSNVHPVHACARASSHVYGTCMCIWGQAFYDVPYAYEAINLLGGEQGAVSKMEQVPRLG